MYRDFFKGVGINPAGFRPSNIPILIWLLNAVTVTSQVLGTDPRSWDPFPEDPRWSK